MMVGDYVIGTTLGRGSYAKVVQARNSKTGEQVAMKIMDRKFIERENVIEYVKKEISVMHSLKHPNVVALKDVLLTKSNIYLVLELVTGVELFEQVATKGALDEDTARNYFQQLLSAVEYCHGRGVCHRDLKLENCVVDSKTSRLKILDFGFSRHLDSFLKTPVGTPTYIAPEALSDQNYDGRSVDVWACGVMLYVMVCGWYPFGEPNSNFGSLYKRIKNAEYTPLLPHLSNEVKALIAKIIVADPRKRITIEDLKKDPWVRGRPSAHSPTPTRPSSAHDTFKWPTEELNDPMVMDGPANMDVEDEGDDGDDHLDT